MIKDLRISNFKSIKSLELDCKRINLFIGAPNVGKSNILEALSLFDVPYIENPENKFDGLVRFSNLKNLFYDNIPNKNIEVVTDIAYATFRYLSNNDLFDLILTSEQGIELERIKNSKYPELVEWIKKSDTDKANKQNHTDNWYNKFDRHGKDLSESMPIFFSSIRRLDFNGKSKINQGFHQYLLPPHGRNLITIIQNNPEIFSEVSSFFEDYKLELLYDVENNLFEIQKRINKLVYKYPFGLVADTLQRIIFYLTVVEANKDTSIIMEEPETHSFPPYTRMLAQRISESKSNQFFITTHSPYLLHNIIENTNLEEMNICLTYFKDYETKLKVLSIEDIGDILDSNTDIFYNLDNFLADE